MPHPSNTSPTALVTGASRGIGRATALALASEGFDIAALALGDAERLASLAVEVQAMGRRCTVHDVNIGDLGAHAPLVEEVVRVHGGIDCLVNNAGVSVISRGDLLDVGVESYDRCFDINTKGTFFLTQAVARQMVQAPVPEGRHRSIVFITSSNAVAATMERGEYCMSKTALSMAAKLSDCALRNTRLGCTKCSPA